MKKILYGVGLVLFFIVGIGISRWYYQSEQEQVSRSQSTVLLEKVQRVCKLVTVEGSFLEHYDETMDRQLTLYLPLPSTWSFSKTAFLEVQGKVMVGYDMEKITITVDSTHKKLILSNLPQPQILSIDHSIRYKNLEESFFNHFTPEDYTQLNRNAKEVLSKKATEAGLLEKAEEQGNEMLSVIRFMAEAIGWEVELEHETGLVNPD
ncbi:MAG: hypothetical protein DHS20C18_06480 [Saprospiraceae bacterium]|nr:MAG: hypothetical protein DHS20C18_06480 [Saprospiraceae bacterium]